MSHGITNDDSMMYVGSNGKPWHGLGVRVADGLTTEEAITQSGLGWPVIEVPLFAHVTSSTVNIDAADGEPLIENMVQHLPVKHKAIMRGDTRRILGVVGEDYSPVQNADAFKFFDQFVRDGLAMLETAGSLHKGRTIWILARIGERRIITGDDAVQHYLLLSTGHDGRRSVQVQPTTVRVVCANTLARSDAGARGVKSMIKLSHTSGVHQRLDDLQAALAPVLCDYDLACATMQAMAQQQASSAMLDAYLNSLFPDPAPKIVNGKLQEVSATRAKNVRNEIKALYEGELIGFDALGINSKGSVWTMYNAVTEYVDHQRGRSQDSRLESAWFGPGRDLKVRAYDLAAALSRSA